MRKDTLATRKSIIDTAERLFAERGVESTSLLEIAKATGQKNRSALQYHFTNKDGLLNAVLDKHAESISRARSLMLDALEDRDSYTLYELVEALVLPMASQLDNEDGGRAFLKIHSQLMTTEVHRELRQRRDDGDTSTRRLVAMAAGFMPTDDRDGMRARFALTGCLLIHGLAIYLTQTDPIARSTYLHVLIQAIVDLIEQTPYTRPAT